MCGIVGLIGKEPVVPRREAWLGMRDSMAHRGPDDAGYLEVPWGFLGFRRLSIIDLAGGHQPMANEDESIWIVFNGEIYNFDRIRKELIERGHQFRTASDTEVLIHLWEEKGTRMVHGLRGMWAFAILDQKRRTLFLSRDAKGKKPLYYAIKDGALRFASEMKALYADPDLRLTFDWEALDHYLTYQYIPAPLTIAREIRKLPRGCGLLWHDGVAELIPAIPEDPLPCPRTRDIAAKELRQRIIEAIEMRLVADVPLGVLLSGGLDSTIIAAGMARLSGRAIDTFSVGFTEASYNELIYADQVAKHIGSRHHRFVVEAGSGQEIADLAVHLDQPFGDPSLLPTWLVSKVARSEVTVVLTGDGGDEQFAGYRRYRLMNKVRPWLPVIRKMPWDLISNILNKMKSSAEDVDYVRLLRRMAEVHNLSPDEFYLGLIAYFPRQLRQELFTELSATRLGDHWTGLMPIESVAEPLSLRWMTDWDQAYYLAEGVLTKVDMASAAVALEVRSPFLDLEITRLARTFPPEWRIRGKQGKAMLLAATKDWLPPGYISWRKQGFALPIGPWFRGPVGLEAQAVTTDPHSLTARIFRPEVIQRLWDGHRSGKYDNSGKLYLLWVLELWHRGCWSRLPNAESIV